MAEYLRHVTCDDEKNFTSLRGREKIQIKKKLITYYRNGVQYEKPLLKKRESKVRTNFRG